MRHSFVLYLTTILIWGSTWFVIQFQLGVVDPAVSLIWRFGLSALLLLAYCVITGRTLRYSLRDHGFIALLGASLFSINYLLFYIATADLTTGLIAVLFSTIIFMNLLNSRLFLGRAIEPRVVQGAVLGLFGIVLVFWQELTGGRPLEELLVPVGLSMLGTLCASIGNVVSARNSEVGIDVVSANALGMTYGALLMLGWAVGSGAPLVFDLSMPYVVSLLYLSLFGSIVAFGAYLTLVARTGASRAAYAMVLFPIVSLVLSWLFEDFQWHWSAIAGVILVLAGNVLIVNQRFLWSALIDYLRRSGIRDYRRQQLKPGKLKK